MKINKAEDFPSGGMGNTNEKLLSINGDYPAGRPFGAVMEVGEDLYLSTNDMNEAHKQMRENEHIQIGAKKAESSNIFYFPDFSRLSKPETVKLYVFSLVFALMR